MTPTAPLGDSIGCMIHFGSDGCCSPRPQKPGKILFMIAKMVVQAGFELPTLI